MHVSQRVSVHLTFEASQLLGDRKQVRAELIEPGAEIPALHAHRIRSLDPNRRLLLS
jgi:hypothetical protein